MEQNSADMMQQVMKRRRTSERDEEGEWGGTAVESIERENSYN